jgi:hypothetical protein
MLKTNYLVNKYNLKIIYVDLLPFKASALIKGDEIFILKGLTEAEENTLITEEICHKALTAGNILNTKNQQNNKQEILARRKAYLFLLPFITLKECYDRGLTEYYEVAEYLCVTEKFLREAINQFKQKFGLMYYDSKTNCYFSFGSSIQIIKKEETFPIFDYGC